MNAIASLVAQNANAVAKATKPAPKQATKAKTAPKVKTVASTKSAAEISIKFRLITGRASAGPVLWAHTAAWLELSGLTSKGRPMFSKKAAIAVAGATAINYHIGKGTFEQVGDKIKLTAGGALHFKNMQDKIDPEQVKGFIAMMKTGKKPATVTRQDSIGAMPEL